MSSLLDAVLFNPASSGTGDFVVSTAVTGFQTPATAGAVNGATYSYRAESADLTQWEIGTGVYTSGSTTLTRTAVLYNSLGTTAKINFTTAPQVGVVALSTDVAGLSTDNTFTGANTISKQSATALTVGRQGTTNPALQVDTNTASSATGLKIIAAAAAAGLALAVISSGTNENLTIDAKGSGTVTVQGTATGAISLARNTSVTGTLGASGDFAVATNKFTVASASGNTAVAGTLGVTGASTFTGILVAGTNGGNVGDQITVSSLGSGVTSIGWYQSGFQSWSAGMTSGSVDWKLAYGGRVGTGTTALTVANATGAITAAGALTVAGQLNINGGAISSGITNSNLLQLVNTSGGATNINKYFRLSATGTLEVVNSAYSAVEFQFADNGNFTANGNIAGVNGTFSGTLAATGTVSFSNTTASTSTTVGAVMIAGGLAVDGHMYVRGINLKGTAAISSDDQTLGNARGWAYYADQGKLRWFSGNLGADQLTLDDTTGQLTSVGLMSATRFVPTGSTVPTNGMYLPAANVLGFSSNSVSILQMAQGGGLGRASAFCYLFAAPGGNVMAIRGSSTSGVSGAIDFSNSADTQCGSINMDQGAHTITVNNSSDDRGKPYRIPLSKTLARDAICALQVIDYDDERNLIKGIGLSAQHTYGIIPSMVTPGDSAENLDLSDPNFQMWMIDYTKAIPHMLAHNQFLEERVSVLEARLAAS